MTALDNALPVYLAQPNHLVAHHHLEVGMLLDVKPWIVPPCIGPQVDYAGIDR